MDPDEVVIEYLRGKLQKARGARADSILKPAPVAAEAESEEMPPEEMAQLQALMGAEAESPAEDAGEMGEECPQCGMPAGQCKCAKGM